MRTSSVVYSNRNIALKHVMYSNYNFSREVLLMQLNILSRFLSKQAKESNGNASNNTTSQVEVRNTSCQIAAREAVTLVYSSSVRIGGLDLCTLGQTQEHTDRIVHFPRKMKNMYGILFLCLYVYTSVSFDDLYGQNFEENIE